MLWTDDEALELAHRHDLPEGALRDVTRLEDPDAQVAAVRAIIAGKAAPAAKPASRPARDWWSAAARLRQRLHWRTEEELEALRAALAADDERRQTLLALRDTLNRLLPERKEYAPHFDSRR